ncbi:MAG: hypothetical protein HYT39_02050 [Candidatus Sungbacteria bacterium]|nr:hypothetical protein [Candidatus Sungbacteria bacterium]
MKTSFAIILNILLLPLLAGAAGRPIAITSLSEGFLITGEQDTIPVGGTITKGLWEGLILKQGGQLIVSASTDSKQISQDVEQVFSSLNPPGRYGFGIALDADVLRSETEVPLTVRVETKNSNGTVIAYAEVHGTLQPKASAPLTVTLSPNTPPSAYYERGSTWNNFSAITFTAGNENVGIQQLTLTRNGGTDADLLNIQLFDGSTRIGTARGFLDGKAVISFDFLLVIPEGLSKTLMIKADINPNANTYSIENGIAIGVANSSDVRAIGIETGNIVELTDFVPVFGNPMGIQ